MNTEAAPQKQYPRVWVIDYNHRVYRRDPVTGHTFGNPIYREHWVEHTIVGETRVSWISSRWKAKIPKKGGYDIAFSLEEVDQKVFIHEQAHLIGARVSSLKDYHLLKKIADLVGCP